MDQAKVRDFLSSYRSMCLAHGMMLVMDGGWGIVCVECTAQDVDVQVARMIKNSRDTAEEP